MTIDIKRAIIRIRLRGLLLAILFVILICVIIFIKPFDHALLGIPRAYYILVLSVIYVAYTLYIYFLDLNYIYYNDDGKKLIFRYFSMRPLNQAKNSVEIPKELFAGFEIKKSLFGRVPKIILYQRNKSGLFRYNSVSLSLLTKKERSILLQSLRSYAPK